MRLAFPILLCLAVAGVRLEPSELYVKKIYPDLRSFASKQALIDSYLWSYFTLPTADTVPSTPAFYMEDTGTILVLAEPKTKDLISAGKQLLGFSKKRTVRMTEIDLGKEIYAIGSDYFPVVTVSAQLSSGPVIIEQETTRTNRVLFRAAANRRVTLLIIHATAELGVLFSSDHSERETITCMAHPGEKVQLQVSNRMLQFPQAQARKLKFVVKEKAFEEGEWEEIKSSVADESHTGALFYEDFRLNKNRCVTDPAHFEDVGVRKWLEWRKPYEEEKCTESSRT